MRLLLDLGNTRLKWAWLEGERLGGANALPHRGQDIGLLLDQAWANLPIPTAVHAASVADAEVRDRLSAWMSRHWACPLHWLQSQASAGEVRNGYYQPEQLGVDRWLALLGAWQRVRGAVCVIDCGSAVTVDILDGEAHHLGGLIAPGLQMMRDALAASTALPAVVGAADATLGRDTHAAIQAGTSVAVLGLMDRARRMAPEDAQLLITGGDAQEFARLIEGPHELCPDLVLEGLAGTLAGG
jgi:type III pantothenate kinase